MDPIVIKKDSPIVGILVGQAKGERIDSKITAEANDLVHELISDLSPHNKHQFAQLVGFTVNELNQNALDFLGYVADQKHVNYGEKAAFTIQTDGIATQIQAKGSTPSRTYITERRVSVETMEIATRPAIQINDLLTGRVNMPRLITMANEEIVRVQVGYIQSVLQAGISQYQTPFYGTATGVDPTILNAIIDYFANFGNVAVLGTQGALRKVSALAGAVLDPTNPRYSDNMIDTANQNGHLGTYYGADLIRLSQVFYPHTTTPIIDPNWLYIIPGGMTGDTRNLKVLTEGNVRSYEYQSPDDESLEVTLRLWFGATFVSMGRLPSIGAYLIG